MPQLKPKAGRKFLGKSPSLDAIGWDVYVSPHTGRAYGAFRLAVGSQFICIHTTDFKHIPNSDVLYLNKLNEIIEGLDVFLKLLGTRNVASFRCWLNQITTGATGSLAYHHDPVTDPLEPLIFFEISSCTSTVRIQKTTYPKRGNRMRVLLENIRAELDRHRSVFISYKRDVDAILESVNKE